MKGKVHTLIWKITCGMIALVAFSSHLSAGIAARFTAEYEGSVSGMIASFHGGALMGEGYLDPHVETVELPAELTETYYAFGARFKIKFEPCQVARKFSFSLYHNRTENDRVTLYCPQEVANGSATLKRLVIKNSEGGNLATSYGYEPCTDLSALIAADTSITTLQTNQVYYGIKKLEDLTSYGSDQQIETALKELAISWNAEAGYAEEGTDLSGNVTTVDGRTTIFYAMENDPISATENKPISVPMTGAVYEFRFIFFIYGKSDEMKEGEDLKIIYKNTLKCSFDCWQVD